MSQIPATVVEAINHISETIDSPMFVYDLDGFDKHIKQLTQSDLTLWYAVKANPLSSVIKVLANNGFGFDVASIGELDQVLAQGISGERILHTGPGKSFSQLQYFLEQGVQTYVVESIQQLNDLHTLASDYDFTPQVLLRVQLRWDEEDSTGNNPLGGAQLTPFGLSANDWSVIELADYSALDIKGLHIFQWGNIMSAERLSELWFAMIEPLHALAERLGLSYQVLDLGGGLGIPYDGSQGILNWTEVEPVLAQMKQRVTVEQVWMELGRYAIGPYGYYVCDVIERKTNDGQNQLIMEGGVNHLMRPAITGESFPASLLRQQSGAKTAAFSVYGPLCTGLDKLGEFDFADDIGAGDTMVFSQCGAYGFSESMPFFLCHVLPGEAEIYQGKVEVVREPLPASWWLR
ncbi:MAG: diaminopimelate decarboxylase [Phenylobacterium sp.]|jgi:diaminopimelate decarboxylase